MKKYYLIAALFFSGVTQSTEDTPCAVGSCGDSVLSQGQTNANSPVFNSTPNMMLSGSNIAIQNNVQATSRIADISCQNDTLSLNGYANKASSETLPVSFENRSDSWGIQAAVNIVAPWDKSHDKCLKAQDVTIGKMEWSLKDENIRMCVDMLNHGFVVSDQIKKSIPQLALCDHIRKMKVDNSKQYEQMVDSLKQENTQLRKEIPQRKVLVGYKEWRIRFADYKNGCSKGCNEYNSISDYLKAIQSNFGKENFTIYAEPYNNDQLISVYLRNNLYNKTQAEMVRQRFVVAGFAAKIQGVRGTEIYK